MQSQASYSQLTFHYTDGRTESFQIFELVDSEESQQEIRLDVKRYLDKPWWILHLPEETIFINMANILKIEVKPPIPQIHGDAIFPNAQRITALTRGVRV